MAAATKGALRASSTNAGGGRELEQGVQALLATEIPFVCVCVCAAESWSLWDVCVGDPCVYGMSFQGAERTEAAQSSVVWGGGILLQTSQLFPAWPEQSSEKQSSEKQSSGSWCFSRLVWGG